MAEDAARHADHRPRLGRGLAALLGDAGQEPRRRERARGARKAPIEFLRPNPRNPRKALPRRRTRRARRLDPRARRDPAGRSSAPIPRVADAYEIIAGERRWRAAQRAGLHEIPIIVVEAGDREALEIAIVENVQRADLNALEEAERLRPARRRLRLRPRRHRAHRRQEPQPYRQYDPSDPTARTQPRLLASGAISAGHARALLAVADPDAIADRIVAKGLTVRDVERLGERAGQAPRGRRKPAKPIDADTRALEEKLGLALGTKVTIRHSGDSGEMRIAFRNFDQLDDFCRRLSQPGAIGALAPAFIAAPASDARLRASAPTTARSARLTPARATPTPATTARASPKCRPDADRGAPARRAPRPRRAVCPTPTTTTARPAWRARLAPRAKCARTASASPPRTSARAPSPAAVYAISVRRAASRIDQQTGFPAVGEIPARARLEPRHVAEQRRVDQRVEARRRRSATIASTSSTSILSLPRA